MTTLPLISAAAATETLANFAATLLAGSCEFHDDVKFPQRIEELSEVGYLVARVSPSVNATHAAEDIDNDLRPTRGETLRGGLRDSVEGAIEIALALRGAVPPAVSLDAPALSMARDQMFRVRAVGSRGLCLVMPRLSVLGDAGGLLCDSDAELLDVWRQLAGETPVVVLLHETDRRVKTMAPATLGSQWGTVEPAPESAAEPAPEAVAEAAPEPDAWKLVQTSEDQDTGSAMLDALSTPAPSSVASSVVVEDDDAMLDASWDQFSDGLFPQGIAAAAKALAEVEPKIEAAIEPQIEPAGDPAPVEGRARLLRVDPLSGIDTNDIFADEPMEADPVEPSVPLLSPEECDALCDTLDAADGPKPVSRIESLFTDVYLPLLEQLEAGVEHSRVRATVDGWRASFADSYRESFKNLRVTGRRPSMVFDAIDDAIRIGRAHGARSVELLLVDGMRCDIHDRVDQLLEGRLSDTADRVESRILWSALPTRTPTQLHLLSRGESGLTEEAPQSEADETVHRARSAHKLRRLKIGKRDLLKLDVVEARFRQSGTNAGERLDDAAIQVARVIDRLARSLPERTLLYVFGDHGFCLPVDHSTVQMTTGPAEQGGAAPEQVLTRGTAWVTK